MILCLNLCKSFLLSSAFLPAIISNSSCLCHC
jgi:hypothetical protein